MFHELSEKVMDKAFIKTREYFQNSYPVCKSNDAWIEETHPMGTAETAAEAPPF